MTVTLRIVLDQVAAPTDPDLAAASAELARALVRTAPDGCEVAGIVPAGDAASLEAEVPGLAGVRRAPLPRRELAIAWQMGMGGGEAGGLVHAPSLMAPLVRHDRVHDADQTVVTMWDLAAWERPDELPKSFVAWQRGMLKRAVKHADAVVVPTHATAERVAELGAFGERVRVIAGAPPEEFAVPADDVGRRRVLELPHAYVLTSGSSRPSSRLADAFRAFAAAAGAEPVVVIGVPAGDEAAVRALAAQAGIGDDRLFVRGALDRFDRAAVLRAARVLVAPSTASDFPWRVVEALRLGVPVVASDSAVHRDVVADGGALADEPAAEGLAAALERALGGAEARRMKVLSADRGRAFSWLSAAEKVWHLHAEL
ncbi:glycosyltransferase [Microbacterium sp. No. 7]|uniref:glycosyltransferase n=1 Tax=Microbacterium sp. No. 7 TaxID=1714373 RepID=UPI0006D03766|nr:glycosyltransferase [Microbacterium sp. No. 7]ALJ19373.1 glycosyl transferase [Microbacterium sp. No. 7]